MRAGRKRHLLVAWLARWGFRVMVGAAALVSLACGVTAAVPDDVPGVALGTATVYRLEVGGAVFIGLYLVVMSFVLSLQNRGFTEISSSGVRAHDLDAMPELISVSEVTSELLSEIAEDMKKLREDRK